MLHGVGVRVPSAAHKLEACSSDGGDTLFCSCLLWAGRGVMCQ